MLQLNDDLLLFIFNTIAINRAVDIKNRQDGIRHASQVCRRWRDLILSASYIWGRLIWVHNSQRLAWMQEVLERAKSTSLFSVTVDLSQLEPWDEEDQRVGSFAVHVLAETWERLEEVNIEIYVPKDCMYADEAWNKIYDQTQNPAPNLRIYSAPLTSSFGGSAPLLRSFTASTLPSRTPWLSHVTTLEFTPYSFEDIVNTVSWAPHLRVLRLQEQWFTITFSSESGQCDRVKSMSPAILARLARVSALYLSLDQFNALWSSRYVTPAESYSNINIKIDNEVAGQAHRQLDLINAVSNFFYHHSGITSPNIHHYDLQWHVEAYYSSISIQAKTHSSQEIYMRLEFECHPDGPTELPSFLARVITNYAQSATNLHVALVPYLKPYRRDVLLSMVRFRDSLESRRIEVLDLLLSSMEAVESITLNHKVVRYCNRREEEEGRQLFPNLRTVNYDHGIWEPDLRELKAFLMRRVHSGQPVSRVHFADTPQPEDEREVYNVLREVSRLQITYGEDGTSKM
ncbi:hypothetical protein CPC08DRAFT_714643 [Agrocybe pediades]|nr:hypothetical protein CPC08DRAFT_714643 [Agrocybe pediades]